METAHDGASCLARAGDLRLDVAFIDIAFPASTAMKWRRQLRQRPHSARPMMLVDVTGYGQETDRERSARAGFDPHLVNPVDVAVLGELLGEG